MFFGQHKEKERHNIKMDAQKRRMFMDQLHIITVKRPSHY